MTVPVSATSVLKAKMAYDKISNMAIKTDSTIVRDSRNRNFTSPGAITDPKQSSFYNLVENAMGVRSNAVNAIKKAENSIVKNSLLNKGSMSQISFEINEAEIKLRTMKLYVDRILAFLDEVRKMNI
jgi:flagellar hook-basal body complex protein FliE